MLYRFRPSTNIEFSLDILKHRRLYCADWRSLNDPMEGTYDTLITKPGDVHLARVKEVYAAKLKTRVCSLSKTYKSHTMWAYYAEGFRGLAIELKLPKSYVREMDYASGLRIQKFSDEQSEYQIAERILTTKHSEWANEREMRILHESEFYPLPENSILRVILGSRASTEFIEQVTKAAGEIPVQKLTVRNGNLHAE